MKVKSNKNNEIIKKRFLESTGRSNAMYVLNYSQIYLSGAIFSLKYKKFKNLKDFYKTKILQKIAQIKYSKTLKIIIII